MRGQDSKMIRAKKRPFQEKKDSFGRGLHGTSLSIFLKRNLIFTSSQNGVAGQQNSGQFAEDVDKMVHYICRDLRVNYGTILT